MRTCRSDCMHSQCAVERDARDGGRRSWQMRRRGCFQRASGLLCREFGGGRRGGRRGEQKTRWRLCFDKNGKFVHFDVTRVLLAWHRRLSSGLASSRAIPWPVRTLSRTCARQLHTSHPWQPLLDTHLHLDSNSHASRLVPSQQESPAWTGSMFYPILFSMIHSVQPGNSLWSRAHLIPN